MEMNRREFIEKMGKGFITLNLALSLPSVVSAKERDMESLVKKEGIKWQGIKVYDYIGELTEREMFIKKIEFRNIPENIKNNWLNNSNNDQRLHWFVTESAENGTKFIEPSESELRDYQRFINGFSKYDNIDLLKNVYEKFQERIGGIKSYNNEKNGLGLLGDSLLHPAVLLSKRERGICADKAFALQDIYKKFGFKIKLPAGYPAGKDVSKGHMWNRLYINNNFFYFDPTMYEDFKIVRRINSK